MAMDLASLDLVLRLQTSADVQLSARVTGLVRERKDSVTLDVFRET
jgi:hypothetical protein